ncbi:hypothetical protein HET69_41135 [Streptomyces sp. CJ_13]|uniref:SCO4983 family protein n=1 Tax=Streptomyces TaxID=1883 RepID=UPI000F3AA569|nr:MULTISPECIES: hypothetical protein [unclassified Streptomyces]AYV29556.1 hypothetical protein EES41_22850 [Streptomyces sp. ADI95-16]MBT1190208.1 hypothetical protein [Streptomyces sp. CJ_13]
MYEPIRTKSVVHRLGTGHGDHPDYPHSSRGEALDIQLAGHLAALLAVTDELGLVESAERIAGQVARLRGAQPARLSHAPTGDTVTLHQRAHDLAARALLVAASRADTTAAILAAERMDAHAAALDSVGMAGAH